MRNALCSQVSFYWGAFPSPTNPSPKFCLSDAAQTHILDIGDLFSAESKMSPLPPNFLNVSFRTVENHILLKSPTHGIIDLQIGSPNSAPSITALLASLLLQLHLGSFLSLTACCNMLFISPICSYTPCPKEQPRPLLISLSLGPS